jgi:hypothetical protein
VLDLQLTFEYVHVPLLLRFLYFDGMQVSKHSYSAMLRNSVSEMDR